jgi:hypothetical protein
MLVYRIVTTNVQVENQCRDPAALSIVVVIQKEEQIVGLGSIQVTFSASALPHQTLN